MNAITEGVVSKTSTWTLRLHNYLLLQSDGRLIGLMVVGIYIVQLSMVPVAVLILGESGTMGGSSIMKGHWLLVVIVAIIGAPIVETFIFQLLVIRYMVPFRAFRTKPWLICFLSGSLFAAAHAYSVMYVIAVFPVGILLAYTFWIRLPSYKRAFWVVSAVHALRNTGALIIYYWL